MINQILTSCARVRCSQLPRRPAFGVDEKPGRVTSVALAMLCTLVITLTASLSAALAQSRYSAEGANQYVRAKDWNGLRPLRGRLDPADPRIQPHSITSVTTMRPDTAARSGDPGVPAGRAARSQPARLLAALGVQFMKVKRFEDAVNALKRATESSPASRTTGTTSPPPTGRRTRSISRSPHSTAT